MGGEQPRHDSIDPVPGRIQRSGVLYDGLKETFLGFLTTHSTHFIYCYMAPDIW